jgi:DNA recombination-dependent growth factor C
MPITKGTTALTMFRVKDVESLKNVTRENLKKLAVPPLGAGDEKAAGLVPLAAPFDASWAGSPEYGEYLAFALRADTKKIPAAVLRRHFEEASAKETEKPSRGRKKELKEQIKLRLLTKAEAVPAVHEIVVNRSSGAAYVASTSNPVLQAVGEYMQALKCEMEEFGQSLEFDDHEAVGAFFSKIVMDGVRFDGAEISACGKITIADDDARIDGQSKTDSEIAEIREAIRAGKRVVGTGVKIETSGAETCTCSLGATFRISGMKLPATEKSRGEDPEAEFEAALLERMFLIEKITGILQGAFAASR